MLLKKRLIIAFIIMILSLPEGKPCMAMKSNGEMVVSNYSKGKMEDFNMKLKSKKKKNRYDVSAGDDFFVFGNGDDCKVGEKVICKTYVCHLKAGETVSITWDSDKELKSGDFEIGLINKKSGEDQNVQNFRDKRACGQYFLYGGGSKTGGKELQTRAVCDCQDR